MRFRLSTAGCAYVAGFLFATSAPVRAGDEPAAVENTVRLDLQIAGLGAQGGKIEIKPAHPGCQFKTIRKTIAKGASADVLKLDPIAVTATSTGVDRDCSFEITLTEPGRKPRVFRRGLQLTPKVAGAKTPERTLKCHLPAATVAAKEAPATKTRR